VLADKPVDKSLMVLSISSHPPRHQAEFIGPRRLSNLFRITRPTRARLANWAWARIVLP
jgi:hypothetical protein